MINYYRLLCVVYEVFIRKAANQQGIFIPLDWKINLMK